MTIKVLRSKVGDCDFAAIVKAHAAELKLYSLHCKAVKRGEADPYPPPWAPQIVEDAIRRPELVPDYELVEDVDKLRDNKNALLSESEEARQAAIHAILPLGKHMLAGIQYNEAKARDKKTKADEKLIAEHEARVARIDAVNRHAAHMMSQIEDLTDETIGKWAMLPFK